jgi:hypothetical protein
MPLPTDKVRTARTFRKCAADPVGTDYHTQAFAFGSGVAYFSISRGRESLTGQLAFACAADLNAAVAKGPIFHSGISSMAGTTLTWSYDGFGDMPFSALKSGSYRNDSGTEWGTEEVFLDCIDEVRRVLGMQVKVEAAPKPAGQIQFGGVRRRLML